MADFFEWTDRLTLGVQEIDDQHRGMLGVLNRLAEKARQSETNPYPAMPETPAGGMSGDPETESETDPSISQLLDELTQHTQEHFRSEEELMVAYRYPGLNEHRREHTMLFAELKSFVRDITSGTESLDKNNLCALKQWLIVHIRESDKAFADFVHKSSAQS